jgi:hypothetical protein
MMIGRRPDARVPYEYVPRTSFLIGRLLRRGRDNDLR